MKHSHHLKLLALPSAVLLSVSLFTALVPAAASGAGGYAGWTAVSVPGVIQPAADIVASSGYPDCVSVIFQGISNIYSSQNGGAAWQGWPIPGSDLLHLVESASINPDIFALDLAGNISRSQDRGATWAAYASVGARTNDIAADSAIIAATGSAGTPLSAYYATGTVFAPTPGPAAEWVSAAVDPVHSGVFYLSQAGVSTNQLYKCSGGAVTWTPCGSLPAPERVTSLSVVWHGPLLVGTDGTGTSSLYRSNNGGVSWYASASGLPSGTSVRDIAVSKVAPYNAYLATDHGAFVSYDGGTTWSDISGDIPTTDLNCITASGESGNTIYAGAADGNIFKLEGLPWIMGINPTSGSAGTSVVLTGQQFGDGTGSHVSFCGATIASASASSWSDSQIKVRVPAGVTSGEVVVTTPLGSSNPVQFTVTGSVTPSTTWYLAEGSTGSEARGSFETWVLIQNPTAQSVSAQVTFMTEGGAVAGPLVTLAPNSRQTVNVADTLPQNWSVSTVVTSAAPIIVERSMYWNQPGIPKVAAHDSIGVTAPATSWYLAEGSTGVEDRGSFETWVLIQNPGDQQASVTLTYMTPKGPVDGQVATLQPRSRKSFNVAEVVPNNWDVSTKVTSSQPVIAERAMYWTMAGAFRQAAHDSIGVTRPAPTWYLAEGCTGADYRGGYETWVLVQNPGTAPAKVNLTYMLPTGAVKGQGMTIPAGSRQSFNVGDVVAGQFSVSTMVTSDNPVIAERAVYFTTTKVFREAATDSIGVEEPATTWYLAEGCTGQVADGSYFETWVLLMNPGDNAATAKLTYMTETGPVSGPTVSLPPDTRTSINVSNVVWNNWSVSTMVTSDNPVIAERSMYWNTPANFHQAGHDSIGVSR